MIYLDNAATSWPKPPCVIEAVTECLRDLGASPGRSGHAMAQRAAELVLDARMAAAELFRISNPLRIIFTHNATAALNMAIKGLLQPGDHVVTTAAEHNAVMRPLAALATAGIAFSMAETPPDASIRPDAIERLLRPSTKFVIATHASNVIGAINPIEEIAALLRPRKIPLLVDASQTAGSLPVLPELWNVDLMAFPGHKGLLGPQGTGGLYIREGIALKTLMEGGTGSDSALMAQPDYLPDRLEPGTMNTPGLAGLAAGIRFLLDNGGASAASREKRLTERLLAGLATIPGVTVYGPGPETPRAGLVAMNLVGYDAEALAAELEQSAHIAVRAGLHCAPSAHAVLGTLHTGSVRFSLGRFNTPLEIETVLNTLAALCPRAH